MVSGLVQSTVIIFLHRQHTNGQSIFQLHDEFICNTTTKCVWHRLSRLLQRNTRHSCIVTTLHHLGPNDRRLLRTKSTSLESTILRA